MLVPFIVCIILAYLLVKYAYPQTVAFVNWMLSKVEKLELAHFFMVAAFVGVFIIFYWKLPSSKKERRTETFSNVYKTAQVTDQWQPFDVPNWMHQFAIDSGDSILLKDTKGREYKRLRGRDGQVKTYTMNGDYVANFGWMQDWYFYVKRMPGVKSSRTVSLLR